MKFALLQLNFTVGDLEKNGEKIIKWVKSASTFNVDLCVTSELALLGYPPRDLLLNDSFVKKALERLGEMAKELSGYAPVLVGVSFPNKSKTGKPLYNAAVLIANGKIKQSFYKSLLPTYDVFDEARYFDSGPPKILELKGKKIGVSICEDIWIENSEYRERYRQNPIRELYLKGMDYLVNLSASPYVVGKQQVRRLIFKNIGKKYHVPVVYVNQVGGYDDLVFDGRSCVTNISGDFLAIGKAFEEDLVIADTDSDDLVKADDKPDEMAEIWSALILGTRDYVEKCSYKKCLVGVSGGIDSALTLAIATEAVGSDNVLAVLMPSRYTKKSNIGDALELSENLGVEAIKIPIDSITKSIEKSLQEVFALMPKDITEENIQARVRGIILMAISNKFNAMLISTGNKSEIAVGYTTLYGDLNGGLAVISDLPKTMVFELAKWVNKTRGNVIPLSVINKAPSAELRYNQRDEDSLPAYEILDQILYKYVELRQSTEQIVKDGFKKKTVEEVFRMVKSAEFKRKQAPYGIKIFNKSFGTGWRMPIAAKY